MDKSIDNLERTKEAIFKVVSFFDIFDFPLTAFEIWQYLPIDTDLFRVEESLQEICGEGKLISKNGFFCLKSRENIIITRLKRYNYAERKFKKAKIVSQVFKFIPWIKLVAVGNILGSSNLRDGGDIDFFIITQKNRLWLTRLFSTVLMKVTAQRPAPGKERDKICLSFYVSDDSLNLENLMLSSDDLYFMYWLVNLEIIFDSGLVYNKLMENNTWIFSKLPNWRQKKKGVRHQVSSFSAPMYKKIWDLIFYPLENIFYRIQKKRLPSDIKQLANKDSRVVVSKKIIKLHTNDRREEFLKNFKAKQYG